MKKLYNQESGIGFLKSASTLLFDARKYSKHHKESNSQLLLCPEISFY